MPGEKLSGWFSPGGVGDGLFWLLAVAPPVTLGAALALAVWTDLPPGAIGGLGALGGTVIGLAGAWFGITMSIRRLRISETKAKLDGEGGQAIAGA